MEQLSRARQGERPEGGKDGEDQKGADKDGDGAITRDDDIETPIITRATDEQPPA